VGLLDARCEASWVGLLHARCEASWVGLCCARCEAGCYCCCEDAQGRTSERTKNVRKPARLHAGPVNVEEAAERVLLGRVVERRQPAVHDATAVDQVLLHQRDVAERASVCVSACARACVCVRACGCVRVGACVCVG
jgi:hypothetical protein